MLKEAFVLALKMNINPVMEEDKLMDIQKLKALSLNQLVDYFAEVIQEDKLPASKHIDAIKQSFVRKYTYAKEKGSTEEQEMADLQQGRFHDLLGRYDELSKKLFEERQALFAQRKEQLEEAMSKFDFSLSKVDASFTALYDSYKDLDKLWQTIGDLDPKDYSAFQKYFEGLRIKFFELEGGEELKAQDFSANKEEKLKLLAEIEKLVSHSSAKEAVAELNVLIKQWHYVGLVAPEDRAEIQKTFKELCYNINKRHQDFHSERISAEDVNYNLKVDVCYRLEELLAGEMPKSNKAWQEMFEQVKGFGKEYKEIGYSGRGKEKEVYQRFKAANDIFFQRRSEHLAEANAQREENLRLKRELVEEAKNLRDSEEWEETITAYKELRERWKKIGVVPRKYSDKIWEEFNGHCNHFFERLKKEGPRQQERKERNAERRAKILASKQAVIDAFEALKESELEGDELRKQVKELTEQWRKTEYLKTPEGVAIFERYKDLQDYFFEKQQSFKLGGRLEKYEAKIRKILDDKEALDKESKLLRFLSQKMEADLLNMKHNQNFVSTNSKAGEKLMAQIHKKEKDLRNELDFVNERLALLKKLRAEHKQS